MVQHGKTLRWWNNPRIKKLSRRIKEFIKNWNGNPFYFRHEVNYPTLSGWGFLRVC